MKIVVNTRSLIPDKLDGIGWFTYQIMKRLVVNHPEVEFHFLFDRPFAQEFIFAPNVKPVKLFPPARHPLLYLWYYEISVRRYLNKINPDLFLAPDGILSLAATCRQLAVIHDINFLHYPEDLAFSYSRYYNYFMPMFARKATRIVTVSEFSKQDILHNFHIPQDRIGVVSNGINEGYRVLTEKEKAGVRALYTNGHPYFLFVGSLSPRKNLIRLVKAFDTFKKNSDSQIHLLIAGSVIWGEGELQKVIHSLESGKDIHCIGHVHQDELVQVMGAAFALTFVSYFEGFGIPLVEAMQCGVPILCSNTSCMPEIAGDAAIYTDPFNTDEMARQMERLVNEPDLVLGLIANGNNRKALFSWDHSANRMWEEITTCLSK